jgi:hypothetical protein
MNYTPTPVTYQGLQALKLIFGLKTPRMILDPSAGSGGFGAVIPYVFPGSRTKGIEMREEEAWWLSRNYDKYEISKFEVQKTRYELIVTNPPFDQWVVMASKAWKSLAGGGFMAFIGLTSWGSRSTEGVAFFKEYCPVLQMRIPGTWVWKKHEHPWDEKMWVSINLPRLEAKDRTWVVPPGKESGYGQHIQTCRDSFLLSSFEW